MPPETELEIRTKFLETTTEDLNNLECILLQINTEPKNIQVKINAALGIIHSLKSNVTMLKLGILSDLFHRLEETLQVLKCRKTQQEIDPDLHNLLMSIIDWLRHIIELISAKSLSLIDEHWLATFCYPLFEELYKHLGRLNTENMTSKITIIKNENIIHLLFQTEVEKTLQSLENLFKSRDTSVLLQATMIRANELAGLGEMLDIPAFTQICQSIKQLLLTTKSEQSIIHIVYLALRAWRRSQSLILAQKMTELPSVIHQYLDLKNASLSPNYFGEINIPSQSIPAIIMEGGGMESTVEIPTHSLPKPLQGRGWGIGFPNP